MDVFFALQVWGAYIWRGLIIHVGDYFRDYMGPGLRLGGMNQKKSS